MQTLIINGIRHQVDVEDEMPLLWVLRDDLGLTGTKFGCSFPVIAAVGAEIKTIEGLSENGYHPVQQAWIEEQVPQCGYCQSGQIMATTALLKNNPESSEEEIEQKMTNLCRCGTYVRVRRGIRRSAELILEQEG